ADVDVAEGRRAWPATLSVAALTAMGCARRRRSARWHQQGLRCDASRRDLAGQQGRGVLVAEVGPQQGGVGRACRVGAGATGQGRYRGSVPGRRAGGEAAGWAAAEHERVRVGGADGMGRRVDGLEAAVDRYPGQAWQRRGELPERRWHAELPIQRVREYQAVQQPPLVVVLVGGLVERGAEGRACEQAEGVAQAAEDQEV